VEWNENFSVSVAVPLSYYQLHDPGVPWHSVVYYFVIFSVMSSMNTCVEFLHNINMQGIDITGLNGIS
jgi:hypothetical protein